MNSQRPFIPGRQNIDITFHRAPLANPVAISIPKQGTIETSIVGGLSKLEFVAAQIAGHLANSLLRELAEVSASDGSVDAKKQGVNACYQSAAIVAAGLAQAILAECHAREAQEQQPQPLAQPPSLAVN